VSGQVRRRQKQRREAGDALAEALDLFERIGTPLWAERARQELRRLGLRTGGDELTPTERQVAELAHESGQNHREGSYSADGRRIVYVRGRARDATLAIVRADGTHNRVVAHRVTVGPIFSPNGKTVVYDNTSQIFSIGTDGSGFRALTPPFGMGDEDFAPTYSPDGSQIVFNCNANDIFGGLCSMAPDGSNVHPIFSSDTEQAFGPEFAPNGRKVLVLLLDPDFDAIATVGLARGDVHIIRRFGTSGRDPLGALYSPNGRLIAMTIAPSPKSDDADVWVMRADGTHLRRLTHTPGARKSSRLDDWQPLPKR
jgi:Tol biopolymer transport system component